MPAELRELVICLIAVLNDAEYEFRHHLPEYIAAGAPRTKTDALSGLAQDSPDLSAFSDDEQAVIRLTRELTLTANVSESTLATAHAALGGDTRRLVELVGVIATYNMVSRFLNALGVEAEE